MITGTKILLQPPYTHDGLGLSYAEADARLSFFLTYFDTVVPIAFNPILVTGTNLLSTEKEQQLVLHHGNSIAMPGAVDTGPDHLDRQLLDKIAAWILTKQNEEGGGFALASAPGFDLPNDRPAVDRLVLTLEDCLPSIHHETPLEDILAFKSENSDQLRAFHEAVDELYYGFGTRPLDSLLPRFKDRMDAHVESILTAYEHRQIRSYMGVVRVALRLGPGVLGEVIGKIAGVDYVGGLVGGAIGLLADRTRLPTEGNMVPKDFEYIVSGLAKGHSTAFPDETPMQLDYLNTTIMDGNRIAMMYPNDVTPPTRGSRTGGSYRGNKTY